MDPSVKPRAALCPLTALALLGGGALALPPGEPAAATSGPDVRVIVQLDGDPLLATGLLPASEIRSTQLRIEREQDELLDAADGAGLAVEVVAPLTATVNGLVATVDPSDMDALAELPGVREVYPDGEATAHLVDSVELTGAPQVWEQTDGNGLPVTGQGVTVAVIDTGVDYTHPDLGSGFGAGHRVVDGYDFVNDDADPMDDNGHGTHVAGTIAADGEVTGMAPGVNLTAYKVLGSNGRGVLSDILLAVEEAVAPEAEHRADVLNLSLGVTGEGAALLGEATAAAVASGVVVVASAGNTGPASETIGYPAAEPAVLSVGASVSGVSVPRAQLVAPEELDLRSTRLEASAPAPQSPVDLDLVDLGDQPPGDVDVAGKAVLLEDSADNLENALAAEEAGAEAALFYIPVWQPVPAPGGTVPEAAAPVDEFGLGIEDGRFTDLVLLQVPGATGETLSALVGQEPVTVRGTGQDATDQLADFSSRGPTVEYGSGPDLVAPGVEILSTVPGGHARSSGTSMSAPHVAGAAALVRQLHPDWSAPDVQSALSGSARPVPEAGPFAQGAGRLDVPAAAAAPIVTDLSSLSLGLAERAEPGAAVTGSGSLELRNISAEPITPVVTVQAAPGPKAAVSASVSEVTIAPGHGATLDLQIEVGAFDGQGEVSGWLEIDADADASPDLRVPYSLVIREVSLSASPDPVGARGNTTAYLSAPTAAAAPQLRVDCPGVPTQEPSLTQVNPRLWQAEVTVGGAGVCTLSGSVVTDAATGNTILVGADPVEVVPQGSTGDPAASWQSVGPHAASGHLLFDAEDNQQMAVIPTNQPAVFITQDRMRTWQQFSLPVAGGDAWDAEAHPTEGDVSYLVLRGSPVDPSYLGKILRTADGGRTWQELAYPDVDTKMITVAATGAVAALDYDGNVRLSTDEGQTWRVAAQGLPTAWDIKLSPSGDLFVAGTEGLQVIRNLTSDPGELELLFEPGLLGMAGRIALTEDTIVLTPGSYGSEIYLSEDDGATFREVADPGEGAFLDLEAYGDVVLAVNRGHTMRSADRGRTWTSYGNVNEFAVEQYAGTWQNSDPQIGETFFVSLGGGPVTAVSGPGQYQTVGVPGLTVNDLATTQVGGRPYLLAASVDDVYRTELPSEAALQQDLNWEGDGVGRQLVEVAHLDTSEQDASVVFRTQQTRSLSFTVQHSEDGGRTWQVDKEIGQSPLALLVHPARDDTVVVSALDGRSRVHVYTSTDGGRQWQMSEPGLQITSLAGDPTDPEVVYAGAGGQGLFRSTDAGRSFTQILDERVNAVAVDPADPGHIVAVGTSIYTSYDGGESFAEGERVQLASWFTDVTFVPDTGSVLVGSGSFYDSIGRLHGGRGVLHSEDGGKSWTSISAGMTDSDVTSMALSPDGRWLFVGTLGGGVHRIQVPSSAGHSTPGGLGTP